MKKGLKNKLLMGALIPTLLLTGCNNEDAASKLTKQEQIYNLAVESGYTGTYEQWLLSIKGATGEKGEKGDEGEKGDPGENGKDGTTWLTGITAPDNSQGKEGDFYYDSVSLTIYQKNDGVWAKKSSLAMKDIVKIEKVSNAEKEVYKVTYSDDSTDTFEVERNSFVDLEQEELFGKYQQVYADYLKQDRFTMDTFFNSELTSRKMLREGAIATMDGKSFQYTFKHDDLYYEHESKFDDEISSTYDISKEEYEDRVNGFYITELFDFEDTEELVDNVKKVFLELGCYNASVAKPSITAEYDEYQGKNIYTLHIEGNAKMLDSNENLVVEFNVKFDDSKIISIHAIENDLVIDTYLEYFVNEELMDEYKDLIDEEIYISEHENNSIVLAKLQSAFNNFINAEEWYMKLEQREEYEEEYGEGIATEVYIQETTTNGEVGNTKISVEGENTSLSVVKVPTSSEPQYIGYRDDDGTKVAVILSEGEYEAMTSDPYAYIGYTESVPFDLEVLIYSDSFSDMQDLFESLLELESSSGPSISVNFKEDNYKVVLAGMIGTSKYVSLSFVFDEKNIYSAEYKESYDDETFTMTFTFDYQYHSDLVDTDFSDYPDPVYPEE